MNTTRYVPYAVVKLSHIYFIVVCGSDFSRKLEENQKMLGKLSDLERAMISGSNFIVKVSEFQLNTRIHTRAHAVNSLIFSNL